MTAGNAIFRAIFSNGHPKFDHDYIKLYRWPAQPKALLSALLLYLIGLSIFLLILITNCREGIQAGPPAVVQAGGGDRESGGYNSREGRGENQVNIIHKSMF